MTTKVEAILNQQIEKEGYSSQLYLAMAVWAENQGFGGIAQWLYAQAEEERLHMLKFIHYINERGAKAVISDIKKPPVDFANVKELFKEVLKHEQFISKSINDIVGVCLDERDFTTQSWVQWFVNEQIEEEASVRGINDKLAMLDNDNLYIFDRDIMQLRNTATKTAN